MYIYKLYCANNKRFRKQFVRMEILYNLLKCFLSKTEKIELSVQLFLQSL